MLAQHLKVLKIKENFWNKGYYGDKINVLVIDSGINFHTQQGMIVNLQSAVPGDNPDDERGHGTAVAGVINSSNNFKTKCGMAPKSIVYNIDAQAGVSPDRIYDHHVAPYVKEAFKIAIKAFDDGKKFHIMNCSFNVINSDPECVELIRQLVIRGVVPIISTNNFAQPVAQPYADLNKQNLCLAIGASDYNGNIMDFSNLGADFYLPGIGVTTLDYLNKDNFIFAMGTSFSAPICSGLVALLIEKQLSKGNDIFKFGRNNVSIVREYVKKYLDRNWFKQRLK